MACKVHAPVSACIVCTKLSVPLSAPSHCQLQAISSTSLARGLSRRNRDRITINGEYNGDDFVFPKSTKCAGSRASVATSLVSSVASICTEEATAYVRDPVPSPRKEYVVRETKLDEELWAAAWIRAESYCEDQPFVRYIDSYKKNFAEQEFDALKRRLNGKYGQSIRCICFVAVTEEFSQDYRRDSEKATTMESIVGTLDLSVRQLSRGKVFPGESTRASLSVGAPELQRSLRYGYIANVCVTKAARGNGIASSLLKEAINTAKKWDLKEIFVHVNASNKVACHLYSKYQFESLPAGAAQVDLQNIILLRCQL